MICMEEREEGQAEAEPGEMAKELCPHPVDIRSQAEE